jgi:hypothetical protein
MSYTSGYVKIEESNFVIESTIAYHSMNNSYVYTIIVNKGQTVEQKSFGNGVDCVNKRDDRVLELCRELEEREIDGYSHD